ncbi:universal stress protein [Ideonella sp.]|uniref:universal stress protein n=1 Tax=Ideonella sp. TaxID=1929293 RepID=UPI0035B4C02B
MKILLPVDGSDYTKRMLSYIAAHDELVGGGHEFIVFTAVTPVPTYAARFLDHGVLDAYYREQAHSVLGPVQKFCEQNGWNVRVSHTTGHAVQAIAAVAAEEKPDLIVMGTHGHTAFGNVLLGSVASGVLARCHLPVLLVP